MNKLLSLFKISLLIVGIAAALFYGKVQQILQTKQPVPHEVIVQIPNGASLKQIAAILAKNNLVENADYFYWYARFNKIYPHIKAGEYMVDHDVALKDVADLLTGGKIYFRKITFPEGMTSAEFKQILSENEFLSGEAMDFPEGSVLPETYYFSRGQSRQSIIDQAQAALNKTLTEAWNARDKDLPLKNPQELLILASIVEKETGMADERPQVASVFVNRLKKGMLLQTDPTVIYAVTLGKEPLNRPLRYKDLEIDSPYNTYKYAGLPPTPICNAGRAAIMAAANPDKTPYLYFVASGTGGHNFARTLSEHNANVRQWRAVSK
jgi:UPF0755 protein